jgi:NAD-dependent dihydropyrimidine dehydrogenase PreA subunit
MGLVHTGPRQWREHDPQQEWISYGNCHPTYSFPFLAGQRMGLEKVYPRAYYVASIDWETCTHCGQCIGRCPFGAFFQDGEVFSRHGETRRRVQYDDDRCWGCGLCVNTCPEAAINMRPLG